jgi:hypothetical protein
MYKLLKIALTLSGTAIFLLNSCSAPAVQAGTGAAASPQSSAGSSPTSTSANIPVTHAMIPAEPVYMVDQIAKDCNTGARLLPGSTNVITDGCDYWNRIWLERPAASSGGAYEPALDILWSQAGKSDPWIYLKVKVDDLSNMPQGFKAGFELDTNLDSRGNYLLFVQQPTSTSWSTDGVQVWQDTNGDVGGSQPFHYDTAKGNGYETKVFDSGSGTDPDLAWARISPSDPNVVEFALKASLLPNQNIFGWWAWVGLDSVTPSSFELVDHDQDGQTWSVDNTCSWVFGQKPAAGELANQCAIVLPTPTVTPTNLPGYRPTHTPTPYIIG